MDDVENSTGLVSVHQVQGEAFDAIILQFMSCILLHLFKDLSAYRSIRTLPLLLRKWIPLSLQDLDAQPIAKDATGGLQVLDFVGMKYKGQASEEVVGHIGHACNGILVH